MKLTFEDLRNLIPFGLTPVDALALLAGVAALLMVVAIWSVLLQRDPMAAKARALAQRNAELRAALVAPKRRKQNERAVGMMRSVVRRLNLLKNRQGETTTMRLA